LDAIRINLATFDFRYQRMARLVLIGVAAAVLLISLNLIRMRVAYQSRISAYHLKIEHLESRLADQRAQQEARAARGVAMAPEQVENNVIQVSRLVARDVFPIARLLDLLETNLPEGIQLRRLEANENIGAIVLEGVAESMDRVSLFVNQLESLEDISRVALGKLTFHEGKNEKSAQGAQQISFVIEGALALDRFLPAETYGNLVSILEAPTAESLKEK
jgi:Tfp pilus assembly protein PilN